MEGGVAQLCFGQSARERSAELAQEEKGRNGTCYSKETFYDSLNPDTGLRHWKLQPRVGTLTSRPPGALGLWAGLGESGLERDP